MIKMYGCMCGCGGWGYGPHFARWPGREDRIEWLEAYQRDLEQRVADVADEIKRLKERPQPVS
jgi:hypothetical protein